MTSIDTEYFADTDTLSLTFDESTKYDQSDEILPGFLVDYGVNQEIIRFDISNAKLSLQKVLQSYKMCKEDDQISISLSKDMTDATEKKSEDDRIRVSIDKNGRYLSIHINHDAFGQGVHSSCSGSQKADPPCPIP